MACLLCFLTPSRVGLEVRLQGTDAVHYIHCVMDMQPESHGLDYVWFSASAKLSNVLIVSQLLGQTMSSDAPVQYESHVH